MNEINILNIKLFGNLFEDRLKKNYLTPHLKAGPHYYQFLFSIMFIINWIVLDI